MKARHLVPAVLGLLCLGAITTAQHSKDPASGGGKTQISLPAPRSVKPSGGRTTQPAKILLQFVTRNEDGDWYFNPEKLSVRLDVVQFVTAFSPSNLTGERERLFRDHVKVNEFEVADRYRLTYIGTIFVTEIICSNGRYRFRTNFDVSQTEVIGFQSLDAEWTDWRDTDNTPWERVRAVVCKGV